MPTAALVLGGLGLVLCWIPVFGVLGTLLGLIGVPLGLSAALQPTRPAGAVIGLVLGLLALVLGLAVQVPILMSLSQVPELVR